MATGQLLSTLTVYQMHLDFSGLRGHPVLNEPNELGDVEVVCANESVQGESSQPNGPLKRFSFEKLHLQSHLIACTRALSMLSLYAIAFLG